MQRYKKPAANMKDAQSKKALAKKAKKKKRDPHCPKRPQSAYLFFVASARAECRVELQQQQGANVTKELTASATPTGPKPTEVMKLVGQKWREATAEDKQVGRYSVEDKQVGRYSVEDKQVGRYSVEDKQVGIYSVEDKPQ
jgi:hypothetical protein